MILKDRTTPIRVKLKNIDVAGDTGTIYEVKLSDIVDDEDGTLINKQTIEEFKSSVITIGKDLFKGEQGEKEYLGDGGEIVSATIVAL